MRDESSSERLKCYTRYIMLIRKECKWGGVDLYGWQEGLLAIALTSFSAFACSCIALHAESSIDLTARDMPATATNSTYIAASCALNVARYVRRAALPLYFIASCVRVSQLQLSLSRRGSGGFLTQYFLVTILRLRRHFECFAWLGGLWPRWRWD